jgi:hypothetical protein
MTTKFIMKSLLTALVIFLSMLSARAIPPVVWSYQGTDDVVSARGEGAVFNASIYAFPAPSFQWKFQGANISGQTNATASSSPYYFLQLALDNVQPSNAGIYTLFASNTDGVLSRSATLKVEPLVISGPYSMLPPYDFSAESGTEFTLSAGVSSSLPVTYRWRRFGTNFPGTNSFLMFPNMSAANVGDY